MTTRDNATVVVRNAISGARKVTTKAPFRRPAKVHNRKIHPAVLAEAMRLVGNDISRLTVVSETEIRID